MRSSGVPSTADSLVLGFAARLSPALLAPFVSSLRATGYRGRIGFVLAHYGEAELDELRDMVDVTFDVSHHYASASQSPSIRLLRGLRTTRGLRRLYPTAFTLSTLAGPERGASQRWRTREYELEGLQSLRYGHYEEVLRDLAPAADQVMLTDLRDVVFQADPFNAPLTGLEVFLEDESCRVGVEHFNSTWIRNLYGQARLGQMAHETVSCSGTVFGTGEAVLAYLREMKAASRADAALWAATTKASTTTCCAVAVSIP